MRIVTTLREQLPRIPRDRWRRRLLIAWISFPIFELLASASLIHPPSVGDAIVELLTFTALGVLHAALAPDDWRGSALWPAALGTAVIVTRLVYASFALAFDTMMGIVPLLAASFFLVAFALTRYLDRWIFRHVPAVLLSATPPLLLYLVVVGPAQTFGPFLPEARPSSDGPPVVVISVDALRADAARTMATFERLASRGAAWERASSSSSWTWPAVVSLWSGVDAKTHGAGRDEGEHFGLRSWDPSLPMLPAELRERGYATAAFVTNPMIALLPLNDMFDHWQLGNTVNMPLAVAGFPGKSSDGGDGADVVDAAIDWIEDAPDEGWLAWVHLYEPHLPYRHAADRELDYDLLRNARMGDWFLSDARKQQIRDAYHDEVRYADRQIERLLDVLEARGVLDHGIVVFTADHGEELWDHGGFEHGHSHHGEITDIPLVLVGPGVAPARRRDLSALEDIAPTVRAMLGLSTANGVDLRAPIEADREVPTYGNLYFRTMRSIRTLQERIIVDGDDVEAYDLASDPGELHPEPRPLEALHATASAGHVDGADGAAGSPRSSDAPAAAPAAEGAPRGAPVDIDVQALRALGYVH